MERYEGWQSIQEQIEWEECRCGHTLRQEERKERYNMAVISTLIIICRNFRR